LSVRRFVAINPKKTDIYPQIPFDMNHILAALFLIMYCFCAVSAQETYQEKTENYTYITLQPVESEYYANMKQGIDIMDKAMDLAQLEQAANFFTEISNEQPKEWLPPYYAAYSFATMCFLEKDRIKRDQHLDKAQTYIDRAFTIQPGNPEIMVLQAYIYQQRVEVDPTNRTEDYGTLVQVAIEDAKKLDPDNPRLHFLIAQTTFFAPESLGGGIAKACPLVKTAIQKYAENKPLMDIAPKWGEALTNYMNTICESVNR